MAEILFENVSKYYGDLLAIDNMSLEIHEKEFFVILGASGAGKTTTLKMAAGIEPISKGIIIIDGQIVNNIPPEKRNMAMVFESYALYSHLSVFENIAFSFHAPNRKTPKKEIEHSVKHTASLLGIDKLLDRRPTELSGGQRQRVALGRALVRNPRVFLMDEPISHLDAKIRNQMRTELKNLRESISTTFIYVTHDYNEALSLGERIAILHEGKILQIDPPHEVFHYPANTIVAESFGDPPINFLDGQLVGENDDLHVRVEDYKIPVPDTAKERLLMRKIPEIMIGIRPHNIITHKVKPNNNFYIPAKVYIQEILGDDSVLTVNVREKLVMILTKPNITFELDETIYLTWNPESMHLFAKETGINLLK